MGLAGTFSLPLLIVILAPCAGGVTFRLGAVDMAGSLLQSAGAGPPGAKC